MSHDPKQLAEKAIKNFSFDNYGLDDTDPNSKYAEWVPDLAAAIVEALDEPTQPAELTEAQRHAKGIIGELVSEAEFGDIGDRLESCAEGLAAIEFDELHRDVADLISKATVTVTWPQPAEQDPLVDPDCAGGKCGSCVGGPCEHHCHTAQAGDAS